MFFFKKVLSTDRNAQLFQQKSDVEHRFKGIWYKVLPHAFDVQEGTEKSVYI